MGPSERKREIVKSLRAIQGTPFGELLPALRDDGVTDKALGHHVLAKYLGPLAGEPESTPILRTLPVSADKRVREPTKVRQLEFQLVSSTPFSTSKVAETLRAILFIPILKPDTKRPAAWSFGLPFLWSPAPDEWTQLGEDYERVRAIILRGDGDSLSSSKQAGYGRILMPKTSGRSRQDLETYEVGARTLSARRRAFFLRQTHTSRLLFGRGYPPSQPAAGVAGGLGGPGADFDSLLEQLVQIFDRHSPTRAHDPLRSEAGVQPGAEPQRSPDFLRPSKTANVVRTVAQSLEGWKSITVHSREIAAIDFDANR